VSPLLELIPDWKEFLKSSLQAKEYQKFRQHERTGRPLWNDLFIDKLEVLLGDNFGRKKLGRKVHGKTRGNT
jgi:putative transposase